MSTIVFLPAEQPEPLAHRYFRQAELEAAVEQRQVERDRLGGRDPGVADGVAHAVVLNSGGANACTGPEGFLVTVRMSGLPVDGSIS